MSRERKYLLTVNTFFNFIVLAKPEHVEDWLADGIKLVEVNKDVKLENPLLCGISIRGKRKQWDINTWINKESLSEYRQGGVKIDPILNTIPKWWVDLGFSVKLWCFLQDMKLVW